MTADHAEQADTIRRAIDVLYNYTSDLANPPGEGRSQWRADGWAAVDALVAALAAAEQRAKDAERERDEVVRDHEYTWGRLVEARKLESAHEAAVARADALTRRNKTLETVLRAFEKIAINGKVCTPPDTTGDAWEPNPGGLFLDVEAMTCPECKPAWRKLVAALAGEEGADE